MRHRLLPLLLFAVGCSGDGIGGNEPCGGASYGTGNRVSASRYVGTYSNASSSGTTGAAKDLDFDLTITEDSHVSGTVSEPSTGRTTAVSGRLVDWFDACSDDATSLEIGFAFEGDELRTLAAAKEQKPFTRFSADAAYYLGPHGLGSPRIGKGRLLLDKG